MTDTSFEVSFDRTPTEDRLFKKIVARAVRLAKAHGQKLDGLSIHMDLTACHANGCPLDLKRLLAADDFNFSHDVLGIERHMCRDTGQLKDHFLPRFASKTQEAGQ